MNDKILMQQIYEKNQANSSFGFNSTIDNGSLTN